MKNLESGSAAAFRISATDDIIPARHAGRVMARRLGFTTTQATLVASVISELARNIVTHAGAGEIVINHCLRGNTMGLTITASDNGPGIPDTGIALRVGYSTSGAPGCGLPGVRRIADEFILRSAFGQGTFVSAVMWLK